LPWSGGSTFVLSTDPGVFPPATNQVLYEPGCLLSWPCTLPQGPATVTGPNSFQPIPGWLSLETSFHEVWSPSALPVRRVHFPESGSQEWVRGPVCRGCSAVRRMTRPGVHRKAVRSPSAQQPTSRSLLTESRVRSGKQWDERSRWHVARRRRMADLLPRWVIATLHPRLRRPEPCRHGCGFAVACHPRAADDRSPPAGPVPLNSVEPKRAGQRADLLAARRPGGSGASTDHDEVARSSTRFPDRSRGGGERPTLRLRGAEAGLLADPSVTFPEATFAAPGRESPRVPVSPRWF